MRLLVVFTLLMSALALQTTKAGKDLSIADLLKNAKNLPEEIQHIIAKQIVDNCPNAFYPLVITENTKHKTLFSHLLYQLVLWKVNLDNMCLGPDGKKLAFELWRGRILILNGEGWKFAVCCGPASPVYSLQWSPDGGKLAAIFRDDTVCIWNEEGKLIAQWKHKNVRSLNWSPNGEKLASLSATRHAGKVWIWDEDKGSKSAFLLRNNAYDVRWSPNGELTFIASDGTIKISNEEGVDRVVHQGINRNSWWGMARLFHWSANGNLALIEKAYGRIHIFDESSKHTSSCQSSVRYKKEKIFWKGFPELHPCGLAKWTSDGEKLVLGFWLGNIGIWDKHGKTLAICRGHEKLVWLLSWSPKGELISSSWDGTIRNWNIGDYLQGRLTLEQVILVKLLYAMAKRDQVNTLTDLAKRINTEDKEPLFFRENEITADEIKRILKSFGSGIEKALCARYKIQYEHTWSDYAKQLKTQLKNKYVNTFFIAVALVYWLKKRGSLPWLTMEFTKRFVRKILSCVSLLKNKYVMVLGTPISIIVALCIAYRWSMPVTSYSDGLE